MRNRGNDEGIKLHERRAAVVDVPLTGGKPVSPPFFPSRTFNSTYILQRNYSRREVEMKREKARKAKVAMKEAEKQKAQHLRNTKSASAGNSRSSQSNVTQQPGGEASQTQPAEELHSAGVSNSSTAPNIAATSAGATCWTCFRSAICCASTQNADGHH
jgi:hypothetical protein